MQSYKQKNFKEIHLVWFLTYRKKVCDDMFITLKRLDFKDNEGKGNKYQGLKSILKSSAFLNLCGL